MDANLYGISDNSQTVIGEDQIAEATTILTKYKQGKANLERRIIEDEQWWKIRHWEVIKPDKAPNSPQPSSAWLFNAITNKHADAMDNYPEPVVLPRERSDEESAKMLSSILPVVMEYNNFEKTYRENWWEKLKHGTAAYGVFWNQDKDNGLGDIELSSIDLLNLFWEPGITNIQDSRNIFITKLEDKDILESQYPDYAGRFSNSTIDVAKYIYDDTVDTTDKCVVIDWYYKVKRGSKTVLQYVKYCGNVVLYASENDPVYREIGWYEHGKYPVVLDILFPEKGTPAGFGYVAICKDPQLYIDKLSANILESSLINTKKRYFVSGSTNINEDEFLDWTKPIIHVEGSLEDRNIQELITRPLDGIYLSVMQQKIDEMKDTGSNRDVNSGGVSGGVTAAAAVSALQEAGNKTSRDMISASYDVYKEIAVLCVELMRQFYDAPRSFRITGSIPGQYEFADITNSGLADQPIGTGLDGEMLYRKPVFDLKIKAQKTNPFSRMEQNERAKELYNLGFFNPERAQESLSALDMMDFEGIDKIKDQISQGATLLNICQQLQARLSLYEGMPQVNGNQASPASYVPTPEDMTSEIMQSQKPMTSYQERLVKRSKPSIE